MRLSITSIASIALVMASVLGIASAQGNSTGVKYGICTCFRPKFDASCCMLVKGYMMNDGNVCETPDNIDSVVKFRACCVRSGGKNKCKYSEHEPNNWPPEDTYGCSA
ncbi:hypothetical protein BGZ96_001316 [Linnemannia gamsii]|uniref:Uncharacterized protein n=1 Tax=Linnemannia gamsii TaxID=64522 RepID=A0ABQ7JMH9_9FUNG|nr:hypothetical protein BGZ96_001316 [Linnemannia gamsii]